MSETASPVADMVARRARARSCAMRASILCAVAAALAGSALLGVSGWFLVGSGLAGLAGTAAAFNYLVPGALIRLAAILRTAGRYGERLLSHQAAILSLAEVRTDLLGRLAATDPRRAAPFSTGESVARLTSGIDALEARQVQAPARPAAIAAALVALGLAGWASPMALPLLALALLLLPAMLDRLAGRLVDPHIATAEKLHGHIKAELAELLMTGPELAVYGLAETATIGIRQTAADMDSARLAAARGGALVSGLLLVAGPLLAALTFALSRGNAAATAAAGLAVLVSAEALGGPLRFRLEQARTLTGLAELELLAAEPPAHPAPLPPGPHPLRLAGETLHPGDRLLLTGRSGSGKTSLLETLAGLRAGSPVPVLVGGRPAQAIGFASLSALFALVPQHPALIAGTVEDNLRLARPGLPEAELWRALETACLAVDVRALPCSLSTFLGEGGARLSGGQVKRLALARALLAGRPWLLLDEPSEGLDGATEAELARRLVGWLDRSGCGAVIATHRPALASVAARTLSLG